MFGSVGDWFYKALAGIDHAPGDVGFQNFVIAPSVVGDLMAVNASFLSGTLFLPSLFSPLPPSHLATPHIPTRPSRATFSHPCLPLLYLFFILSFLFFLIPGSGNISVSWQKQGGSVLCGSAPEGHIVSLDCASIGSEGVIEEISFASFGKRLCHHLCKLQKDLHT